MMSEDGLPDEPSAPKDLMMGASSEASPKQLRELHIRMVKPD